MPEATRPLDYCNLPMKIETLLTEMLNNLAIEENLIIQHNYSVYASKRGLNLQVQIVIRPKEGT
jgi:hypothetical protein